MTATMRTAGRERIDRLTARYLPLCVVRLCMKHDINPPGSVTEYCPPTAHVQRFPPSLNSYFHIWVPLVIVSNAVKELKDDDIPHHNDGIIGYWIKAGNDKILRTRVRLLSVYRGQ